MKLTDLFHPTACWLPVSSRMLLLRGNQQGRSGNLPSLLPRRDHSPCTCHLDSQICCFHPDQHLWRLNSLLPWRPGCVCASTPVLTIFANPQSDFSPLLKMLHRLPSTRPVVPCTVDLGLILGHCPSITEPPAPWVSLDLLNTEFLSISVFLPALLLPSLSACLVAFH